MLGGAKTCVNPITRYQPRDMTPQGALHMPSFAYQRSLAVAAPPSPPSSGNLEHKAGPHSTAGRGRVRNAQGGSRDSTSNRSSRRINNRRGCAGLHPRGWCGSVPVFVPVPSRPPPPNRPQEPWCHLLPQLPAAGPLREQGLSGWRILVETFVRISISISIRSRSRCGQTENIKVIK